MTKSPNFKLASNLMSSLKLIESPEPNLDNHSDELDKVLLEASCMEKIEMTTASSQIPLD